MKQWNGGVQNDMWALTYNYFTSNCLKLFKDTVIWEKEMQNILLDYKHKQENPFMSPQMLLWNCFKVLFFLYSGPVNVFKIKSTTIS